MSVVIKANWAVLPEETRRAFTSLRSPLASCLQCADEAMSVLHGRVVNGVKMKVMLADPPREESHKRLRTY